MANAQCTAVETLDENFENFVAGAAEGALPQNCWTSGDSYPRIGAVSTEGNKSIQFYTFMSPSVSMYLVSPELSTIDGNHSLSFDIGAPSTAGVIKIQVGTMATATDFANFSPVGSEITVMAASTRSNIVIPASTTQKYIAFRVNSGNVPHSATTIDNVKWQSTLSVNDSKLASFSVYPNPSTDRNVTVAFGSTIEKGNIAIYSLAGAKVFETTMQENTQTVNLSDLASGIYIMKLQSGNNTSTKKLILK